jgi:hypothetical protein
MTKMMLPYQEAWWDGYLTAMEGRERICVNPWNVKWQTEWLAGFDEAIRMKKQEEEQP